LIRAPVRGVVFVREADVDGQVLSRVRIPQAGRDRVEAFRRLPVALLDLRPQLARPAADRIGLEQLELAVAVFLPDLELRLLLVEPHQNGRLLAHVLLLDLGDHLRGEWLQRAQAPAGRVVGIATRKQKGGRNRGGSQQWADKWKTIQPETPPTKAFPGPLWLNRNPDGVLTARSQTPSDPYEHAIGERKVNTLYSPLNSPSKRHFGRSLPLPEEGKRSPL